VANTLNCFITSNLNSWDSSALAALLPDDGVQGGIDVLGYAAGVAANEEVAALIGSA
jgi:hypothetical protein